MYVVVSLYAIICNSECAHLHASVCTYVYVFDVSVPYSVYV